MPSRHWIDALLPEIERIFALGWSYAKIVRAVGVSVGTLAAIRAQTRATRSRPRTADEAAGDRLVPANATVGRCKSCGAKCRLPCMACALRDPEPPPRPRTHRITSRPSRELLRSAFLALAVIWSALAPAAEPNHPLYLPLRQVEVVDGDTLRADIELAYGVVLVRQVIRADNYDAWESSHARRTVEVTDEEIARGKQAAADLAALIQDARQVWLIPSKDREPHGRRLGRWVVETNVGEQVDVATWMRARHHCRPGG